MLVAYFSAKNPLKIHFSLFLKVQSQSVFLGETLKDEYNPTISAVKTL